MRPTYLPGENMDKCTECGLRPQQKGNRCEECSKSKQRIWERLGIYGSTAFIVIGALLSLFAVNIHAYLTCGAASCPSPSVHDLDGFFQTIGDGFSTLFAIVGMQALGIVLFLYGLTGLTISLIAIYRKRQEVEGATKTNGANSSN